MTKPEHFWDCASGKAAIDLITQDGEEVHPVPQADGHHSLGVWFQENWKRGCLTPDVWFPDLDTLLSFAYLGRTEFAARQRAKNAYQVIVDYDNGYTDRYDDNHKARMAIIFHHKKSGAWPTRIQALNPFTGEEKGEFTAYRHPQYIAVLRPKDENPPKMPNELKNLIEGRQQWKNES